jgi:hypothetical protein
MRSGWGTSSGLAALFLVALVALAAVAAVAACGGGPVGAGPANGDGGSSGCGSGATVSGTGLQQCTTCSAPANACTPLDSLQACCTWVAQPRDPLADGTGLHRYSTPDANAQPDLSCLAGGATLGTPQTVTLTGYVWLFSSGLDSAGVKVEVFAENTPTAPDGTIAASPLGSYTTTSSDPIDPTDSTWNSKCPGGCSYRQYTIQNVPTETPLVIRTSDAGSTQWATLYDYNVYFKNADVTSGQVKYDATAVAGPDLSTVAGTVGQTVQASMGLLAGEVHDCSDIRLFGATVETSEPHQGQMFYFTDDESSPLPSLGATDTSHLGLFGALNLAPGKPIRVTSVGQCPANAPSSACTPGSTVMLGTYVVQVYAGAVTAVALRGRRPWQP